MSGSERIIQAIKQIGYGQVTSYGQIAEMAGIPRGARLVARILHACSEKHDLPWWRIVSSTGEIALKDQAGRKLQRELLIKEGVKFKMKWIVEGLGKK